MEIIRNVTKDIIYVGASDNRLALFENLFPIPNGVSYNAYLILDEKTCLVDTCDSSVGKQFLTNIEACLNGRELDYLVVNHMEPDHAALIEDVILRHKNVALILNSKTKEFLLQACPTLDFKFELVKEFSEVCLGKHTLTFVMAPMVHWPEVMVCYDKTDKVLFSADAFGTFGALNGKVFASEMNIDEAFYAEARRYYANIVGKYGKQVALALNKLNGLVIEYVCPLHGPIWHKNFNELLRRYTLWANYEAEQKGVLICYASMYGNTENAALYLANELIKKDIKNISVHDVSNTHVSYLISESFRYSNIVLMCPNYNASIYPKMEEYLLDMLHLNVSNKQFVLVENGTWAPVITKQMEDYISKYPNCSILTNPIKIKTRGTTQTKEMLQDVANIIASTI